MTVLIIMTVAFFFIKMMKYVATNQSKGAISLCFAIQMPNSKTNQKFSPLQKLSKKNARLPNTYIIRRRQFIICESTILFCDVKNAPKRGLLCSNQRPKEPRNQWFLLKMAESRQRRMQCLFSQTYATFVFSVQTIKSSRIKENKKRSYGNKETIIIRYETMTKDAPKIEIKTHV